MNNLLVLVKKDLLEQVRTKKILILLIVFLFVAVASPIFAKLTPVLLQNLQMPGGITLKLPEPTYKDSLDQFIKNISQIGLLVLVFLVAGAISDEKNKKTLEIILTKPVSRINFILSKYVAYFASISVLFLASGVIFYYYTATTLGSFDLANFLLLSILVLLYILMILSITILASTLVNNSIVAGGIGFVSFILFGTIFSMIDSIKKYSPNTVFSNYQDIVKNGWNHDLVWPTILIISIITISIILAVLVFKNQEVER